MELYNSVGITINHKFMKAVYIVYNRLSNLILISSRPMFQGNETNNIRLSSIHWDIRIRYQNLTGCRCGQNSPDRINEMRNSWLRCHHVRSRLRWMPCRLVVRCVQTPLTTDNSTCISHSRDLLLYINFSVT